MAFFRIWAIGTQDPERRFRKDIFLNWHLPKIVFISFNFIIFGCLRNGGLFGPVLFEKKKRRI